MTYQLEYKEKQEGLNIIKTLMALGAFYDRKKNDWPAERVIERFINNNFYSICLIKISNKWKISANSGNQPHTNYKTIKLEEFVSIRDNPQVITIKLNSEYTAEVEKETIKVGCTVFPVEILYKLVDAHKSLVN